LPRKIRRNWTKTGVLVGILIGYLSIAIPIIVLAWSVWDLRDIIISIIAISLIFYILFNEVTKEYAK